MNYKTVFDLLRISQWYKNFVIFIPLTFGMKIIDTHAIYASILGFICLCILSSSYYIINDAFDAKRDILHPEKKLRPIASGKVKIWHALLVAVLMLSAALLVSLYISAVFFLILVMLFIFSQIYNFCLKKILFADILAIATNFSVKSIAGIVVINGTPFSPWLIICAFFLALIMALGKRKSEIVTLGNDAHLHKPVLGKYDSDTINMLLIACTAILVMSYALYIAVMNNELLLITLPFVIYGVAKYVNYVNKNAPIAGRPEKLFGEKDFVLNLFLWISSTVFLLYFVA